VVLVTGVLATGIPVAAHAEPTPDLTIPGPVRDHRRGDEPARSIVGGTVTVKDFPLGDWREDSVDAELFVYNAARRTWLTTGRVDLVPLTGEYSFDGLDSKRYRIVFTNWQGAGLPRVATAPFTPQGESITIDATIDIQRDASGDGLPDLIARDSRGAVFIYRGTGDGRLGTRVSASSGLSRMTALVAAGDLDSNGVADLLARDSTGTLWLYRANGSGSLGSRIKVGNGFAADTLIVSAGDVTGDLRPDMLARDASGALWLYEGTGIGGFYSPVLVGDGWDSWISVTGAGDLTGDTLDDIVTRDSAGTLWLLAATGNGTFAAPVALESGWGDATAVLGAGDFTGDGLDDLVTRDAFGALWVHAGDGRGGLVAGERFATGFARLTIAR
jgi:hypothetical protein